MDATRSLPPMHVYVGTPSAGRLQPSPMPLESQTVATTGGFVLNPTAAGTHRPSPKKPTRRHSSSRPAQGELGFVAISAPQPQIFTTDSPAKRPPFPRHSASLPSMAQSAFFTTFSSVQTQPPPKNGYQSDSLNESFADFPEPSYGSRPPRKRILMDAAPLTERVAKKQKCDEAAGVAQPLPDPQEMPLIDDDGTKPPYSYATLIGMSILRAPKRRLTLAQIYNWISETFSYYQRSDPGWQNSIRHNLSLNKAFVKQERPKDDPGKGNYWTIEPGMESQFLKDKPLRRATMTSLPLPAIPHGDASGPARKPVTTTWIVSPPPPIASAGAPQTAAPAAAPATTSAATAQIVDLSSDATIPASDPALQDETGDEISHAVELLGANAPRSSPPPAIHSSPPVAPAHFRRQGTPPTPFHRPVTSSAVAPRSRKRKSITTLNDSGYFSSLESSAMRPNKAGHILTSDIDIEPPRIKRGRAEEEIARIRSSSHDISPRRPSMLTDAGRIPSSPLRGDYISMLPPPLTPVIKFKKPAKPPQSVSPNTNLRNHRKKIQQMVNSPLKHLGLTDEDLPWSPAFNIHDESFTPNNDHLHATFDVFADVGLENMLPAPANGSPEKRSVKRARTDSAAGLEGHALADITATSANNRTSAQPSLSALRAKAFRFPDSPTKPPNTGRYIDATDDDFFSFHLFDESPGEVDGVDLLQGFQKIGGSTGLGSSRLKATTTNSARPHLTPRSHTSLF